MSTFITSKSTARSDRTGSLRVFTEQSGLPGNPQHLAFRHGTAGLWKRVICLVLVGFTSLLVSACNPFGSSPKAEQAVVDIHALYNASDFETLFRSSSQQFQEAQTYSEAVDFLQSHRTRLGPVVSSEKTSNMVKTSLLLESTVTLGYATTYEHGQADETFVFQLTDGQAILLGWSIE